MTEVILREVTVANGQRIQIPLTLRASIHATHLQHPDDRQHIPSRIRNQLQLMGTNPRVDGAGHLLASSSVGEMERSFYYAPQVARLNRTPDGQTPQRVQFDRTIREFSRDNLELAMLIGIWLSFMICHHQVYV